METPEDANLTPKSHILWLRDNRQSEGGSIPSPPENQAPSKSSTLTTHHVYHSLACPAELPLEVALRGADFILAAGTSGGQD